METGFNLFIIYTYYNEMENTRQSNDLKHTNLL